MLPRFKALLFDLDGTLADSSVSILAVLKEWCARNNLPLESTQKLSHGGRTEDTVALAAPHLCAKTEASWIERMEFEAIAGMRPIAGADDFLATLTSRKWAIVTSSTRLTAMPKIQACGLTIPEVLITAESVSHGKPHPEPFLQAAEALGVDAADCLAFEDAENGVRAALAAGCRVIVIGGECGIQDDRILARIPSFAGLSLNAAGELTIGNRPLVILESGAPSAPLATAVPAHTSV